MSRTEATIPPKKTAPTSGGISRRAMRTRGARRIRHRKPEAQPHPVYSRPASSQGLTSPRKALANGVPAPNSSSGDSRGGLLEHGHEGEDDLLDLPPETRRVTPSPATPP